MSPEWLVALIVGICGFILVMGMVATVAGLIAFSQLF